MRFLFKDQLFVLVLFCALFFVFFSRYFKIKTRGKHHNDCNFTPPGKEPILEEDCSETLQKSTDFEEKETPFSALSFRFPTFEEFIGTRENVDSSISDTSNENGSVPSIPDPDFNLHHPREDPENFPQNNLNCTDDFSNEELDIKEETPKENDRKIEDSDKFVSEEENLIELLQKVKGHGPGLPPIPEESEYTIPMEEDPKPWRTKENFDFRNFTKELHKCHKIYRERMQKYDTLNHQKLYAKGELYLKVSFIV